MSGKTVILANGEFPCSPKTLSELDRAERILCCDGAAAALDASGRRPDLIIGDLDSLPEQLRKKYASCLIRETEQETNDLAKAFRFCVRQGWRDLLILGGTGKREDHTLGNISCLADFAKESPGIRMLTETGVFFPLPESGSVFCGKGTQVSIFSMDPSLPVTSEGLKYPLKNMRLPRWWCATLNETLSESFTLTFPQPGCLILYLADERKN